MRLEFYPDSSVKCCKSPLLMPEFPTDNFSAIYLNIRIEGLSIISKAPHLDESNFEIRPNVKLKESKKSEASLKPQQESLSPLR